MLQIATLQKHESVQRFLQDSRCGLCTPRAVSCTTLACRSLAGGVISCILVTLWQKPLTSSQMVQVGGPAAAGACISGARTGVCHPVLAGNAAATCAGCAAPTRWAAKLSVTMHPSGGLHLKAHLRMLSASRSSISLCKPPTACIHCLCWESTLFALLSVSEK